MEVSNHKIILIAILTACILSQPVDAFNLGTLQKSASQNVTPGNTIKFNLLFWNTDGSGYDVKLKNIDVPKDWDVILDPPEFYLDDMYSGNIEHIYIPRLKKTVSAAMVNVYVSVPKYEKQGHHIIVLKAIAGGNDAISGFSLRQERLFFFDVYVTKDLYPDIPNEDIGPKTVSVDISPIVTHHESGTQSAETVQPTRMDQYIKMAIILFVFIFILVIAWGIYKYD